jgi:hypothetical protein
MTANTDPIVVFGCYFGAPEPFNSGSLGDGKGYDRVLITDCDELEVPDGIRVLRQPSDALGPLHESRRAKIMPQLFFPEYTWSIYVDNRASIVTPPAQIIERITRQLGATPPSGRYLFRHPNRKFVHEELDTCYSLGLFDEAAWRLLHKTYRSVGLLRTPDLTQNTIMLQKAGDPETEAMNRLWFEMFLRYCRRDQLTLNLVEHVRGHKWTRLDFPLTDIAQWPVISDDQRAREIRSNAFNKPKRFSWARFQYKRRKNRRLKNIKEMNSGQSMS